MGNWLSGFLLTSSGGALFTTGLVAVGFEYVNNVDAEERGTERLRAVLEESAPVIRDSVVDGFAFAPKSLTAVAFPGTLDRIVNNTLGIRLGDAELAADVYGDLQRQVIGARERWYDAHVSVALALWGWGLDSGKGSMFVATIKWECRFTATSPVLRFSCVSDMVTYREMSSDPTSMGVWYFQPVNGLDGSSADAYELVQVSINGKARTSRKSVRKGAKSYAVAMGES
ncbi:hypothetical protein [Streptomyces sviceus]|uniref:hypothetical protein n=1 Tax=Streptomyces sviceus TaxID=285530 RepID=UPI003680F4F9